MGQGHLSKSGVLRLAAQEAQDYLASLDAARIRPQCGLQELRARFSKSLSDEGVPDETVIFDLIADASGGLVNSASGRFFGWVIGGALPAATAADWLVSIWDQNAALFACSPASAVVEEVAGEWLKQILGLPDHASFAFVTGCQMAHVTCLAAARARQLRLRGWDVAADGLSGAPKIRILASDARHGSIDRAASLLGIGTSSIVPLETDDAGRVERRALVEELKCN